MVNMVIQHRVDKYGGVLATVVYVYNMEEPVVEEEKVNVVVEEDESEIIGKALEVTKGARALIVDENPRFINIFSRLLEQYEIQVTSALSGEGALEFVKNNIYDIIFVAHKTQKIDGNTTVKMIRELEGNYYQQVPIVFVTEADINDVFPEFIETGFNDYLTKPIISKKLSLVLTRWLWQRFGENTLDSLSQQEIM